VKLYRVLYSGIRRPTSKLFTASRAGKIAARFNRKHGEPIAYTSSVTVYL
jgi:hypothetical protein